MNVIDLFVFVFFTANIGVFFYKSFNVMAQKKRTGEDLKNAKICAFLTMALSLLSWLIVLGHLVTIAAAADIAYLKMSTLLFKISTFFMVVNGLITTAELFVLLAHDAVGYTKNNRQIRH